MAFGLLAALSWGVAALGAAVAARRIGFYRTVILGQAAGLAGLVAMFLLLHASFRRLGVGVWLLLLAGAFGVVGYLAFYRGLELGHVGLVSTIGASYGGVTALLAVMMLGERLNALAALGIGLTVAGVTLAAARRGSAAGLRGPRPGVALGAVAAVCYGVGGFLLAQYTRELGWLVPVVVARSGSMAILLGLLALSRGRPAVGAGVTGVTGVTWAVGAGFVDAAGLAFFARGDQLGLVAVTAAVSSVYPLVPIVGAALLFGERMVRWQVVGVVLILVGLVLLGVSP